MIEIFFRFFKSEDEAEQQRMLLQLSDYSGKVETYEAGSGLAGQRTEFVGQVILRLPDQIPQGLIVDPASGSGAVANALEEMYDQPVVRLELSNQPLQLQEGQRAQADALHLPLADASVGLMVVKDAAEHFPDLAAFFKETQRVLVKGGWLLFVSQSHDHSSFSFTGHGPYHPPNRPVIYVFKDWRDYLKQVKDNLQKSPDGKVGVPYFKINEAMVIALAAKNGLKKVTLPGFPNSWQPSEEEKDWHPMERFILVLEK